MAKLVWSERYNCHRASIGAFELNVSWQRGGYRATFAGREGPETIQEIKAAKEYALVFARSILEEALRKCSVRNV